MASLKFQLQSPFTFSDQPGHYLAPEPLHEDEIIDFALVLLEARFRKTDPLTNPADSKRYLVTRLAGYEHEVFCTLFLDNRHRIIAFEELFRGTIDGCSVYPREVLKRALHHNAAALIFAHNHPSGVAEPSQADKTLTGRLKEALHFIDVRVLDHIIVGGTQTVSFAERGLL